MSHTFAIKMTYTQNIVLYLPFHDLLFSLNIYSMLLHEDLAHEFLRSIKLYPLCVYSFYTVMCLMLFDYVYLSEGALLETFDASFRYKRISCLLVAYKHT